METPPPNKPATQRKPWPMMWVVVAIASYAAIYTVVNIAYRKPAGSAHEPFAEAQAKAQRGVEPVGNDWRRFAVVLTADAAPHGEAAAATRAPLPVALDRAVPLDLALIMPGQPKLAPTPSAIHLPSRISHSATPVIELAFPPTSKPVVLGLTLAYAKAGQIHIFLQDASRHAPGEAPVPVTSHAQLTLPAGALEAGDWQVTVYASEALFTASLRVE